MKLYNTLSRKIEEFKPYYDDKVTFYTCGPTVYSYAHIGNLRNYIQADLVQKTLEYLGYNVKRCMNITDVGHLSSDDDTGDDKMVRSAKKENKTVLDIASYYTERFFEDFAKVNNKKPEIIVPATSMIDDYIKFTQKLVNDGYAYFAGGNVYFDTSKLKDYYVLSNHSHEENEVAVRADVEEDLNKKNKSDFVLWFTKSKFDDQELKWHSPWGYGYPGWHIECSVISLLTLGEHLDIHSGGVDLIFPHHTNEIAQSESYLGHKWCNYWIHNEYLCDKSGKMSKSKGEVLTLSVLEEKGYNPLSFRYMCLQSHYRKQLMFSYESLDVAQNAYQKLLSKTKSLPKSDNYNKEDFNKWNDKFKSIISNDIDTANALTLLYDLLKSDVDEETKYNLVKSFDEVFSLDLLKEDNIKIENEEYIKEMIEKRNEAKKNKDFALADKIRDDLLEKGIILKDTREGTIYEVK